MLQYQRLSVDANLQKGFSFLVNYEDTLFHSLFSFILETSSENSIVP